MEPTTRIHSPAVERMCAAVVDHIAHFVDVDAYIEGLYGRDLNPMDDFECRGWHEIPSHYSRSGNPTLVDLS